MSIFQFKRASDNYQLYFGFDEPILKKYSRLSLVSRSIKSPAIFAGLKYAYRLMMKCNELKNQLLSMEIPTGYFARGRFLRCLERQKALFVKQSEMLESWLDSFFRHFKSKYQLN